MTQKIKKDNSMSKSVKAYQQWNKMITDLEKQGMYGAEYYVNRVSELEEEVEKLKEKLKEEKKKNA